MSITYNLNTFPMDSNIQEKKSGNYRILNYDKSADETLYGGIYRSVITDLEGKLLCFSPPSSIPKEGFPELTPDLFTATEIVEGTMVNLFYDKTIESWEIATKGSVGGNYWYYRNQYPDLPDTMAKKELTFRQMFLEAIHSEEMNNNEFVNILNKSYCYSFVLQHPNNHIINIVSEATVYLVAVYEILEENTVRTISPFDSTIPTPKQYSFSNYSEIYLHENLTTVLDMSHPSTYVPIGIMIQDRTTGISTCIENPAYQYLKELRGNNPNLKYQFLSVRQSGRISEFLAFFPKYIPHFNRFTMEYIDFIKETHNGYVSYYVKKSGIKVSKRYFPLVYQLHHNVYLPSVNSGSPVIIKRPIVEEFIHRLEPKSLIYYLNWKEE
jgi:hypothetical protein